MRLDTGFRRGVDKQGDLGFLILWFGIIFVFFTVARTKLHWYIVPVYIPLAIMAAKMSLDNLNNEIFRKVFITMIAVTMVQLLLLHPFKILEKEGNLNIKTVCQRISEKHEAMIVYKLPIYAPKFYSDLKLIEAYGGINTLEKLVNENKQYLLAAEKDFRDILTSYKEKYKITRIAQSGDVVLGLIYK